MKMQIKINFKAKPVQAVCVGDIVKCKDFEKNTTDIKTVKHVFTPTIKHYNQYTVTLANTLHITGSNIHPVWCKKISGEISWVEMQHLDLGDSLYTDSDEWVEVVDISLKGVEDKTFYDFTVGDHHNYYAGKDSKFILSHNSSSVHVPIWHYEIEDIIVLKNNGGTEDNRVRHMDYSIQMSKLFYERFMKNESITLFSPHEVPDLYSVFGMPEFDDLYVKYEKSKAIKYKRTIKASALMALLVKERIETGRIYIMNIDHCNEHGSFIEQVTMSNLCQEVLQPTKPLKHIDDDEAEIGICVLSALNLLEIKDDNDLRSTCDIVVRMLDELIDYQDYFNKAAENFARKRRSLGIGVTNLAALLAKNNLKYTSATAPNFVDEIMEKIQYYLINTSVDLASEKGVCEKFNLTRYSQGILPIDTYKKKVDTIVTRTPSLDWELLRQRVLSIGMRHSTMSAMMPCESSSVIQNTTNGVEPVRSLMTYKASKASTIPVLVPNFTTCKDKYTLAFDMADNTGLINVVAALQKWVDMSISTNLYYNYDHYPNRALPDSVVIKDLLYAYSMGVKTLYYSNTSDGDKQSASDSNCSSGACAI